MQYWEQEARAIAFWDSPFIFGSKQWPCRRSDSRIIFLQSSWLQLKSLRKEEIRRRLWKLWQNGLWHQLGMVLPANSAETSPKDQKRGRGGEGKWGLRSLWVLTTCHHQHSQVAEWSFLQLHPSVHRCSSLQHALYYCTREAAPSIKLDKKWIKYICV